MIWVIIHTAVEAIGWIFTAGMFLAWLGHKMDEWEVGDKKK